MVRNDHHGPEPDGPMAIALGYQLKSVERHRFHMRVISVLRAMARTGLLRLRLSKLRLRLSKLRLWPSVLRHLLGP